MELRVLRVRRIYADGSHCAFTGLTRHAGRLLACFRSGRTHVSFDGVIRVIVSETSEEWRLGATISHPGLDLRDPKLVSWQGAALLFCGGADAQRNVQSFVASSTDGESFSELEPVCGLPEHYWLWAVRPWEGWLYGTAYRRHSALLLRSQDGREWQKITDFPVWGNEISLDFDADGRLWALVREDWHGSVPTLCVAEPPYETFSSVRRLPIRLQGPLLKRFSKACLIVGRRWDEPGRRNLRTDILLVEDGCDPQFVRTLPSGGDTSYAAWLDERPGRALLSYYSSHEYQMDVAWEAEAGSADPALAEHTTPAAIYLAEISYREDP